MSITMIEKALKFATDAHEGQFRKGGKDVPYITHPIAVADILKSVNAPVEVIAGGYLHDTVEDTDATLNEIASKFGGAVAAIVDFVSEPKYEEPKFKHEVYHKKPWKIRKTEYIERLKRAPEEAVMVAAADKLHNIRDTVADWKTHGEDVWSMFNSQKESQFWYYATLLELFEERCMPTVITDEIKEGLVTIHGKFKA